MGSACRRSVCDVVSVASWGFPIPAISFPFHFWFRLTSTLCIWMHEMAAVMAMSRATCKCPCSDHDGSPCSFFAVSGTVTFSTSARRSRRSITPARETSVLIARSVFQAISAARRCLHYVVSHHTLP